MSNNTVIIQVDPPISPPPLGSQNISLVFPPGSQTFPVLGEVRALPQDVDHSCKISHDREMLRESPFNLTFPHAQYSSHFQVYETEIPTLMDTLGISLM